MIFLLSSPVSLLCCFYVGLCSYLSQIQITCLNQIFCTLTVLCLFLISNYHIQLQQQSPTSDYLPEYKPKSGPLVSTGMFSPESSLITMPNVATTLNGFFSLIKYGLGGCNGGLGVDPGYGSWISCADDGQYRSSYGHLHYQSDINASVVDQAEDLSLLLTGGRLAPENIDKIVKACDTQDAASQLRCMQQLVVSAGEFHSTNHIKQNGEDRQDSTKPATTTSTESKKTYKALVYYYMSGGVDSYNMLAPYSCSPIDVYQKYRQVRGQNEVAEGLGLPLTRLLEIQANAIDQPTQPCSSFGINENLSILKSLFDDDDLNFIANAGLITEPSTVDNYKSNTDKLRLFSHDGMSAATQLVDVHDEFAGTGVAGRMADVLVEAGMRVDVFSIDGEQPLLVGEPGKGSPMFIVGTDGVAAINEDPSIDNMNAVIMDINNATTPDSGFFAETWSIKLADIFEKQSLIKEELDKVSLSTVWTAQSRIARELQTITRLMQTAPARGVERDIFYVESGGWDTHSDADVRMTRKFIEMNAAISNFVAELKVLGLWESTVLVQFSEFGRTLDPNTNDGADHAWGGHHFILGGSVKGGKVLGEYPSSFEQNSQNELVLSRGRMIPKHPWDAMWYGTAEWFGVPASGAGMDKVLPMHNNFPPELLYGKAALFDMMLSNEGLSTE